MSRLIRAGLLVAALAFACLNAVPALAHGFTSTAYVDVEEGDGESIHTELDLEYDLLVVSTADAEDDDALFDEGTAAWDAGDLDGQAAALSTHTESVQAYVTEHFEVSAAGKACTPQTGATYKVHMRDVPYATMSLEWDCPEQEHDPHHEIASNLFPDDEGYVKDTKTIVTYDLDGRKGSAALDSERPSFSIQQSWGTRFWDFFRLGAEHLYTGIDHILFLLALIAGSRRLREIVLAATTFTLAHSVTFILAALGVVSISARIVEPLIALSIAVVAGWHLWRIATKRDHASDLEVSGDSHFALDRAGWSRLAVVFAFGLIHGMGFAGALGIDEAFSWTLLWSLLVFNIGIEVVQLAIIAVAFPLLALLRRRQPVAGLWVTGLIAGGVAVMGLIWFVQRVFES